MKEKTISELIEELTIRPSEKEALLGKLKQTNNLLTIKKVMKGDVFWHPSIKHYIVIFKVTKKSAIFGVITTKGEIPVNTRINLTGGFSLQIHNHPIDQVITLPFKGSYGNYKHLFNTYNQIKNTL